MRWLLIRFLDLFHSKPPRDLYQTALSPAPVIRERFHMTRRSQIGQQSLGKPGKRLSYTQSWKLESETKPKMFLSLLDPINGENFKQVSN